MCGPWAIADSLKMYGFELTGVYVRKLLWTVLGV